METIYQIFQSPAWWISTVVVALAINLLSTYLWGRYVDKWLSGRSEKRRKRSEEDKARYLKKVERLSKDPTGLILEFVRAYIIFIFGFLFLSSTVIVGILIDPSIHNVYLRWVVNVVAVVLLALCYKIVSVGKKWVDLCDDANQLRIKRLLAVKVDEPTTIEAKRDDRAGEPRP